MMYVQSVWFLSLYSCYRVAANMEATEPSVPSGEIEVITWNVLRSRHDLVDRYGVSVVQITTDMFHLSKSQSSPFSMHDLSPRRTTTCAPHEAGTDYPSGAPQFTPGI